ncbi:DUF4913 domain-containing protein [Arthrobacter sp. ISL-28]|uniref:DUF4913 domain-containing protein n=1 Tax=Arthrobacter sp. ISL-28 TaxID=2819108 RepID=UPI00288BE118|nr:DUF4913 domain-containing protein [Arthrobacter sp. ISL-28]
MVHAGETAKWSQLTLDEWLESQRAASSREEPQIPEPELFYPDLASFVQDQLAPTSSRNMNGTSTTWCPTWWRHAEAISRLEALWRAWEFLRLDPSTGMSVWWRDHADHHMGVLLSADGHFTGRSSKDGHKDRLQPLKPLTLGRFRKSQAFYNVFSRACSDGEVHARCQKQQQQALRFLVSSREGWSGLA